MADFGGRKGDLALSLALASGRTVREAAALAGLGERTATRRMSEPVFRRQIAELRTDMVQRALGRLADGMTEATDTLRELLTAKNESVRLSAARTILELGQKLREAVEVDERLRALEECAVPALYGCAGATAAILPWIVLHGSIATLALLFALAAVGALLGLPALATALDVLVRRRLSAEELYGRG